MSTPSPSPSPAALRPLTHVQPFAIPQRASERIMLLRTFAETGERNLVLGSSIMRGMTHSPASIRQWREDMAAAGLRFVDAHAPFGVFEDLNCADPSLRPFLMDYLRLCLSIVADFGVTCITIHTGNPHVPGITVGQHHENMLRSLDALLPTAERLGVTICIENIWYPTNTAPMLLDAIGKFPTPALGICYDAGHANLTSGARRVPENACHKAFSDCGMEPVWNDRLLEDLLPHVVTCHLHDNDGLRDHHRCPGDGTVPWAHIMPLLKRAPRLQCYQNESGPSENPARSLSETAAVFRHLLEHDVPPAAEPRHQP